MPRIPLPSRTLPSELKTGTRNSSGKVFGGRFLDDFMGIRSVGGIRTRAGINHWRSHRTCPGRRPPRVPPTLRTQAKKLDRLMIKALAFIGIPQCLPHDAPDHSPPEVVGVVKTVDRRHHFFKTQSGILEVRKLMTPAVDQRLGNQEVVVRRVIVELGPRKSVSD